MTESTPAFDISAFISITIGEHLSAWISQNKNVEITPAEISSALNLPYKAKSTGFPQTAGLAAQMPSVQGFIAGQGAETPKRTGGRKKKNVDPNAPKCIYSLQRGDNKGKVCGSSCDNDPNKLGSNQYCNNCLKKKTVQNQLNGGGSGKGKSTVQPPVLPGGMVPTGQQVNRGGPRELNVVPYDEAKNLYQDIHSKFIIQVNPNGTVIAIGKEENNIIRKLTPNEIMSAQQLGLAVATDNSDQGQGQGQGQGQTQINNFQASQQSVPQIPQVPQVNTALHQNQQFVPQIPHVNSVQVPQGQGQPQQFVPQVPQIPTSHVN